MSSGCVYTHPFSKYIWLFMSYYLLKGVVIFISAWASTLLVLQYRAMREASKGGTGDRASSHA